MSRSALFSTEPFLRLPGGPPAKGSDGSSLVELSLILDSIESSSPSEPILGQGSAPISELWSKLSFV